LNSNPPIPIGIRAFDPWLMKTRSAAMAEESQNWKNLQGQITQLQAEMVTSGEIARSEMQSQRATVENLTQLVQKLLEERRRSPGARTEPDLHFHNFVQGLSSGGSHQDGSSSSDGLKPKSFWLEFPRFEVEDPETWCCRAKQFFDFYGTPDSQRLSIFAFHMDSTALVWFQELKASNTVTTWVAFVNAMQTRFGRGPYDDPMENLSNLKQDGSLEDNKNQFDILAKTSQKLTS
jgi:hypothetical protein